MFVDTALDEMEVESYDGSMDMFEDASSMYFGENYRMVESSNTPEPDPTRLAIMNTPGGPSQS